MAGQHTGEPRPVGGRREQTGLGGGVGISLAAELPTAGTQDRRLIITGLGDRLAPPDQAEKLWQHWDRCALHWFPGNHLIHVSQKDYLRRMTRFLQPIMF